MKVFRSASMFAIGCALLIAAFVIAWARWWELANHEGFLQILMGALGVVVALLVATGVLGRGEERWTALGFAATLILGFSAIAFFSVGMLTTLPGLALLALSIWKLTHHPTERRKLGTGH